MDEGYDSWEAAKLGVGEVALPIIASTATTLAAFLPLAVWRGHHGAVHVLYAFHLNDCTRFKLVCGFGHQPGSHLNVHED